MHTFHKQSERKGVVARFMQMLKNPMRSSLYELLFTSTPTLEIDGLPRSCQHEALQTKLCFLYPFEHLQCKCKLMQSSEEDEQESGPSYKCH